MVIENHGNATTYILTRKLSPDFGTFGIHRHAYDRRICQRIEVFASIVDNIAFQRRTATGARFQSDQLIILFFLVDRFYRPAETQIGRKHFAYLGHGKVRTYSCRIAVMRITHSRIGHRLPVLRKSGLQTREKRILTFPQLHFFTFLRQFGKIPACALFLGHNRFTIVFHTGDHLIGCCQTGINLIQIIGFPKFEIGTTLQKFTHTFGLFHTGKLHKNTTVFFETLYIGSNHTETVDTGTQYIERVVDGTVQFLTQNSNDLVIGSTRSNFFFQLIGTENRCQPDIRIQFFIFIYKNRQKVGVVGLIGRCSVESRIEFGVGIVIGKRSQHISNRNLQRYIHTAFEVQTQTDFHLITLFQSVITKIYFLGCHRI